MRRKVTPLVAAFVAMLAFGPPFVSPLSADTPSERAIKALNSIERPKQMTVSVILIPLLTKAIESVAPKLEKRTGIQLQFIEKGVLTLHDDIMREKVSKLGSFDIAGYIPMWIGDLVAAELILPMDGWIKKYDPELGGYASTMVEHSKFGGRTYGLLADGDAHIYIMRRDVVEHPAERAAFRAKYRRDPGCPKTWKEHLELISFFHRQKGEKLMGKVLDDPFYGTVEARVRGRNYVNWVHRFLSKGKLYFDDQMRPLINSPEGVEATREFLEVYKYMNPAATGWDSAQLLPHYGGAHAFSTIHFAGTVKFAEHPERAKTRGKNVYCVMPGTMVGGRLIQRTNNAGAFAYGVNRYSKYPEVAYLVSQWLASPEIGTEIILHRASFFEPVRRDHFDPKKTRPAMEHLYDPGFIAVHEKQLQITAPLVTLPGGNEYHDKLDIRLHETLLGRLTPEEAMKRAAEDWERITEDEGRARQVKAWAEQKKLFPKVDAPK